MYLIGPGGGLRLFSERSIATSLPLIFALIVRIVGAVVRQGSRA